MGFFFVLIIAAVVIYVSYQSSQQAKEKWRAAAQSLKLSYIPGDWMNGGKIQGSRNGHRVRVSTFTKSTGKSSTTYTKYQIVYRDRIPFDLKMTKQGAMFAIKQLFGYEEVELDDPAFDAAVVVRSAQPHRVKEFLDSDLRDTVRLLVGSYPTIEITNEHVMVTKTGRDNDPSVIGHCVRRLEAFSEEMVGRKQGERAAKPKSGPGFKSRPVYEIKEDPSALPIVEAPEPEVEVAALDLEPRTPKVIELDANPLDDAPSLEPLEEMPATDPVGGVDDPAIREEQGSPPVSPASSADIQIVAEALYGSGSSSSLAANTLFAETYENRAVTGRGALKRVSKFSYDPVFKDRTGTKATLEICEIAGAYSKIKVKAEVVFSAERYEELKAREGASLKIAGTLIAQDAMMNQLYVVAD